MATELLLQQQCIGTVHSTAGMRSHERNCWFGMS